MTDPLFGPVILSNGIRWNPTVSEADDTFTRVQRAIVDLAMSIRGQTPNFNLGQADKYIWVGEYEMALDEIQAALIEHPKQRNELVDILLGRTTTYMYAE